MLSDYTKFDIKAFCIDYYRKRELRQGLVDQLNAADGTRGANDSPRVQSSDLGDPTHETAALRMRLMERINEIDKHIVVFDTAALSLTREEREIIEFFFDGERPSEYAIAQAGFSRTKAYDLRAAALRKLEERILG